LTAALVAVAAALAALCALLGFALWRARAERRRLEALVGQVIDADEAARRRLAQALHDDALQSLLAAHQELLEAAPGRAGVTRAYEVVARTITDLREAVAALHPVTLEAGGLEAALHAIARRAERQGGFRCRLEVDPAVSGSRDELLVAVARELLTNAARHAEASEVSVALRRRDSIAVLEVADDGRGFDPHRPQVALREGHIGLASLTHRLESVGGSLSVDGTGGGTRATAQVPLA
jgi:two-component system, NarL family, sensor kinase